MQSYLFYTITECSNMFVRVLYRENSMGSSITCEFLNQSDASEKTCCVTYGPCDQPDLRSRLTCNKDTSYNIQLEVADRSRYCYTITASNKSHIVKVEGTFTLGIVSNCMSFLFIHDYD